MKDTDDFITTKYPILFVYGMGIRDFKHINSWGRIPSTLNKNGFTVFQGMQDANGSIVDNAEALKNHFGCDCANRK